VICRWCNASVVDSPLRWEVDTVRPIGGLVEHMKQCSYLHVYQHKISNLVVYWKEHLTEQDVLL
jgi:hypothetical protein